MNTEKQKVDFNDNISILPLVQWLDYAAGCDESIFVALPMIQRGSVWKPDQLINLWDTLLRGMPLGSLIHSKMPAGIKVRKIGAKESTVTTESGAIGLIDGQQRTLAMLIPWLKVDEEMDRRIWVDFADKPSDEHLFRLYVTTKNQPFGFQKASPNSKLPLNERREAWKAFEKKYTQENEVFNPSQDFLFTNAKPYHGKSPLDLKILIELWRNHEKNSDTWRKQVESALLEQFGNETISESVTRIEKFANALQRLFELKIPLIKVNSDVFSPISDNNDISDPPLAVLFKRIGTGGTALSDADYVYSVIKHHLPESYDLVETLHSQHNIAGLLSATDLVMTAVRLAAAEFNNQADGKSLTDWESPNKQQFHRLIKHEGFLKHGFLPLLQNNELETAFGALTDLIQYQEKDNGLPLHAFPLLKRPLIQVLLRWIRCVQKGKNSDLKSELNESRADVLRFIMYWQLCVTDPKKASSTVFEQLQNAKGDFSGKDIYNILLEKQVAIPIIAPENIKQLKEDVAFSTDTTKLRGWKRFDTQQTTDNQKCVIALYQRWWGNGYVHPVLLWLQRNYVTTFDGSPVAGREEDTPYDYDHICPSNHWNYWTGEGHKSDCILQFLAKDGDNGGHYRLGNSIGNVRVWDSSENRSYGDDAPNIKLEFDNPNERDELLKHSAIDSSQIEKWQICSGEKDKGRSWNEERVQAFQQVVEQRAFKLYEHFYTELGFSEWTEKLPEETKPEQE